MRHPVRLVAVLVLPIAAVFASSEQGANDTESNAKLVEKYRRDDPAFYERLRHDLRAFHRLPADRQDRLRKLYRDLHSQHPDTSQNLWEVLKRFNAWLERLPEEDRRRVEEAPNRNERLRIIKELREQEFVRRLPKKVQEELDRLPAEKRAEQIAKLREEERQVRLAWNPEGRHRSGPGARSDKPVRPSDLSADAQSYLNEVLLPMLSAGEKKELKDAEGQWPLFARTLLDLSDRHPVSLPGRSTGPTSAKDKDLPSDALAVYNRLTKKGGSEGPTLKKQLDRHRDKWPDFARELTAVAKKHGLQIQPFGPCRPEEFTPAVQTFIKDELTPKLTDMEKDELKNAESKWPEYPEKLLKLARDHNLDIPMMRLPGAVELREKLRSVAELPELPELPDGTLRERTTCLAAAWFIVALHEVEL